MGRNEDVITFSRSRISLAGYRAKYHIVKFDLSLDRDSLVKTFEYEHGFAVALLVEYEHSLSRPMIVLDLDQIDQLYALTFDRTRSQTIAMRRQCCHLCVLHLDTT